jgi:hypothetical protein
VVDQVIDGGGAAIEIQGCRMAPPRRGKQLTARAQMREIEFTSLTVTDSRISAVGRALAGSLLTVP